MKRAYDMYGMTILSKPSGSTATNPHGDCYAPGNMARFMNTGGDHGAVLIIQGENANTASPCSSGGAITFTFDTPMNEAMSMDILSASSGGKITLTDINSATHEIAIPSSSVLQNIPLNIEFVTSMAIEFTGAGAIAAFEICHDATATNPPWIDYSPPSDETGVPTGSPTVSPAPSSSPSANPTSTPSAIPSAEPTLEPLPASECPEDVELLSQVGETDYPHIPIVILEQHTTWVKFQVQNPWVDKINSIFTQFHESSTGETECLEEDDLLRGDSVTYTAYCMSHVPITIVDIWAVDDSFLVDKDNGSVPECCHPPADLNLPVVQYTFKIHCISECVPDTNESDEDEDRRLLETSTEETKVVKDSPSEAAHFCATEDYPCGGADDNLVYVCHYSARKGFQTYCVPEPDSDIVGFYPNDYCGPCVDGYGEQIQPLLRRRWRHVSPCKSSK